MMNPEAGEHYAHPSLPKEPILIYDETEEIESTEAPVPRVLSCISKAAATNPVFNYFARPQQASVFATALVGCLRGCFCFSIHVCGNFGAVALTRELSPSGTTVTPMETQPFIYTLLKNKEPASIASLLESGDAKAIKEALNCDEYSCDVLATLQPQRLPTFLRYIEESNTRLYQYVQNTHQQVVYIHSFAIDLSKQHHQCNGSSPERACGRELLSILIQQADVNNKAIYVELASNDDMMQLFKQHEFIEMEAYELGEASEDAPLVHVLVRGMKRS